MVFVIFKFNRKMSQSKLSLTPTLQFESLILDRNTLDRTYELRSISWISPVKGLPFRDLIPSDNRFYNQILYVTLNNKGELASSKAEITLIFRGYGSKLYEDVNDELFESNRFSLFSRKRSTPLNKRKLFVEKKFTVNAPYLGAGEQRRYEIASLKGQFREAELILVKIKANGHTYFKQNWLSRFFDPVVINHYKHPYMGGAGDSDDLRKLFGTHNPDEKFVHPYAAKNGGLEWLRNLYAEWQRLKRMM